MAQLTVVRCDFCGAEKKESNHWFRVLTELNHVFTVISDDAGTSDAVRTSDACGLQCLVKAMDAWATRQRKELAYACANNG